MSLNNKSTDMDSTKKSIVDSSDMPFSIISVGVGGSDFDKMEYLDCPGKLLSYQVPKSIFPLLTIVITSRVRPSAQMIVYVLLSPDFLGPEHSFFLKRGKPGLIKSLSEVGPLSEGRDGLSFESSFAISKRSIIFLYYQ